jgi:hypothetical protein
MNRTNSSIIPFQPGSQKVIAHYEKSYHPFLYRLGRRRYAKHGRLYFKTATDALTYAIRWAARSESWMKRRVE